MPRLYPNYSPLFSGKMLFCIEVKNGVALLRILQEHELPYLRVAQVFATSILFSPMLLLSLSRLCTL